MMRMMTKTLGLTCLAGVLAGAGCDGSTSVDGDPWIIGDVDVADTAPDATHETADDTDLEGPAEPVTLLDCRLEEPLDVSLNTSGAFAVRARVRTATPGVDPARLRGVAIAGPSEMPVSSWFIEVDGAPSTDGPGLEADEQRWEAWLEAPGSPGSFAFAFRFSGDGGQTWRRCDGVGGEFDPAEAGALTVVADPCGANPCASPPAGCDGEVLETYPAVPVCASDLTAFSCDYGPVERTDCALLGAFCDPEILACVANPCEPNPCTGRGPSCDGDTEVSYAAPGSCAVGPGASAVCTYAEASRQDCAGQAPYCIDGGCRDWRFVSAGELLITEIMVRPSAVEAATGQWFEVENRSDERLNLRGLLIQTASHTATVSADVFVDPGAFAVLGKSQNPDLNGGLTVDALLPATFSLAASGDVITLSRDEVLIDRVNYGGAGAEPLGLTVPLGASLQRDRATEGGVLPADWCAATAVYGMGDRGTPGAPNGFCRQPIGWCRHHAPAALVLTPNTPFEASGRFFAPGLTDQNQSGNDPSALIRAAFALEPADTVLPPSEWAWTAATADPDYSPALPDFEPLYDQWVRTLTSPGVPGTYLLAFRVSGDAGQTWTLCDLDRGPGLDGSENGFAIEDTGRLTVTNPCLPNPCTNPPGLYCEGSDIVNPASTGVCSISGSGFACNYTPGAILTPCPAYCAAGACEDWRFPEQPGDLLLTEYFASASRGAPAHWFELHNPTADPLNLVGLTLTLGAGPSLTLSEADILAPGAYRVVGASADLEDNGGAAVDILWPALNLGAESGAITLSRGEVVIDAVTWSASWPRGQDVSVSLNPSVVAAANPHVANGNAASWCLATTGFGPDSFGTPGAPNSPCAAGVSVIRTAPGDASSAVAVDSPIVINFNVPMAESSLVSQTVFGPCTGTIQLSFSDFATCLPMAAANPALSGGGSTATLTPAFPLSYGLPFRLRVTTGAASVNGVNLGERFDTTFSTREPFTCGGGPVVVISQVYGAGGNANAVYNHDFVELHNRSDAPVSLYGWSLRYANALGENWTGVTNLEGLIPPGGFFLIRQQGGANGQDLPTPFFEGTTNLNATAGKVALLKGQGTTFPSGHCPDPARLVDFVGYGSVSCAEGSLSAGAPAPNAANATHRDISGCLDTNVNSADFSAAPARPRTTLTPGVFCACPETLVANDHLPPLPEEVDLCQHLGPLSAQATRGTLTEPFAARVRQAGLTDVTPGPSEALIVEVGYGRHGTSPLSQVGWAFVPGAFVSKLDGGAADRFEGALVAPMVNASRTYATAWRVSLDGRQSWTYCDAQGSGAEAAGPFEPGALGSLTVSP